MSYRISSELFRNYLLYHIKGKNGGILSKKYSLRPQNLSFGAEAPTPPKKLVNYIFFWPTTLHKLYDMKKLLCHIWRKSIKKYDV